MVKAVNNDDQSIRRRTMSNGDEQPIKPKTIDYDNIVESDVIQVYIYVYLNICIYMYTYMYVCIYMYTYMYVCLYVYIYIYIYMYIYLYV
jgi:hypothetical protein